MAKGIRALLDTVMQALPQVGNLGLLFFLLFFIFAALGVELFGRLECNEEFPCEGLGEHAHFKDFGMSYLTLFRVATGDNWNGIMKDTLRENCDYSSDCIKNCCVSSVIAPLYFVIFVLMAQFVLVNVVVAVLMKHLEESHKQMDDDMEMDAELERELAAEAKQKKLAELGDQVKQAIEVCQQKTSKTPKSRTIKPRMVKIPSLPSNFVFNFDKDDGMHMNSLSTHVARRTTDCIFQNQRDPSLSSFNYISDESPKIAQNVNLREASPDDSNNKVAVTDLSPAHSAISSSVSPIFPHDGHMPNFQHFPTDSTSLSHHCASYGSRFNIESSNLDGSKSVASDSRDTSLFPAGRTLSIPNVDSKKVRKYTFQEEKPCLTIPLAEFSNDSLPSRTQSTSSHAKDSSSSKEHCNLDTHQFVIKPLLDYNSSHPSLSHSDADGDNVPLIVRRLKKKLLKQELDSSMSSQSSDIPSNSRDKSLTTDSTSLDC